MCLFDGLFLYMLLYYVFEYKMLIDVQCELIDVVCQVDVIIIVMFGYYGGVFGFVKNVFDMFEELCVDECLYFDGCVVGLIVIVYGWQVVGIVLMLLCLIVYVLCGWLMLFGVIVNMLEMCFESVDSCLDLKVVVQFEMVGV